MRKLRAAVIGFMVALPAALALPAAVPVAAAAPSCSGLIGSSFSVALAASHGGPSVTLNWTGGSLGAPDFSSGGTVYFTDAAGNVDSSSSAQFGTNSASTITVTPANAYSGYVKVCINGDNQIETAGFYTFNPTVSTVSPGSANEGAVVTANGNFYNHNLSASVGACGVGVSWVNQSAIKFTVPGPADACSGPVRITETSQDNSASLSGSGGNLNITPTVPSLQCASPCYPGSTITVQGSGYGSTGSWSFGPAHGTTADTGFSFAAPDVESGSLSIAAPHGSVSSLALALAPQVSSIPPVREGDTATVSGHALGSSGTLNVGGTSVSPASWSMDQVQFVMPSGVAPQVTLTRDDGQQASGQFTLIPVITTVSPASAAPGSYVEISGSGFGPNPTVSIGGAPAQVALPGDTGIAVTVPNGAKSGKLVVDSSYGQSATWSQTFTVLAPAAAGGSGSTGSTSSGSAGGFSNYGNSNSGTLNVKPNYGFLPLPAPPPGVAFHITAPSSEVKPGTDVPLTISLQLLGKPVAGSTITFQIADSPGTDTTLSAPSAVTDATGIAHVTLHTGKKAGQTIVIAHSGAFADQIRIVTIAPASAAGNIPATVFRNSTLDPHILIPFIGALGLAILLLLGAVLLQLKLNHRQAVPVAAAAPLEEVTAAPRPKAPRKARAAAPATPRRRARPQPPEIQEPSTVQLAAGAEDIADVIPLHPASGDASGSDDAITRTRPRGQRPE